MTLLSYSQQPPFVSLSSNGVWGVHIILLRITKVKSFRPAKHGVTVKQPQETQSTPHGNLAFMATVYQKSRDRRRSRTNQRSLLALISSGGAFQCNRAARRSSRSEKQAAGFTRSNSAGKPTLLWKTDCCCA